MAKSVLISWVSEQYDVYLAKLLLDRGYGISGIYRMLTTRGLGNLDTERAWGNAPECDEAMCLTPQQETQDDYKVATSGYRSIRGNPSKKRQVSWSSKVSFDELAKVMLKEDLNKVEQMVE